MKIGKKKIYHMVALTLIGIAVVISLVPIYWILVTSLKQWKDIFAVPPKFIFKPILDNFVGVLGIRPVGLEETRMGVASAYPRRFLNSLIVASVSTFFAVSLGTIAAYAFSRFEVKGKNDLLFFILSTRMLPPIVVVIPLFLMYRALHLVDTHLGLVLLYTTFNVSFAVWLMKGFIDEIPREYEEAAMVDGYSRFQAFVKVVLPQSITGIVASAVFCFITAWNEFAFALILTTEKARTAPPSIPMVLGSTGMNWGQVASGTFLFLLPVIIFTFLLRGHLLRGVTFGAVRK